MAQVNLSIGGHSYSQSCRDGDEAHLLSLGELLNAKVMEAVGAVGAASEVRQLMLGALLLADELSEARKGGSYAAAVPTETDPAPLEALAGRLEALATKLENGAN